MPSDARLWSLVDGHADPVAYGPLDWKAVNGDWRARVPVAAANFTEAELALEMVVKPAPRMGEPSVLLLHADAPVRRVDVNQTHREPGEVPRRQSHIQGQPPPGFLHWLEPHELLSIPRAGLVSGQQYRQIFVGASTLMGVDVQGVDWIDPPEGRPS